jgi:ABC-2 type transport system permease protein
VLVIGLWYLVGSSAVVDFFGGSIADVLRAIGLGSRFASIERGVLDLRDLVYYLSITGLFLLLNVLSLDMKRWSYTPKTGPYRRGILLTALLVGLNLVLVNIWLYPLSSARVDMTENNEYSLSPATEDLLNGLQEPLLIRGYFSEKTHPLLAPLVPRIRDMLEEYKIASNGKVVVEIIDPLQDPDKETEANQTYGIQPTALQAADRYGASVVNAYFDILIRYGDQSEVLGFQDLIEIQPYRNDVDVRLRNLEYDLTRAIKKSVYGFQSLDTVLAAMEEPVSLTLLVTPDTLPDWLVDVPDTVEKVAGEIAANANGKFTFQVVNPDDPNSSITRDALTAQGVQAFPVSLFDSNSYYLHMLLQIGNEAQLLFPSGDLSEADIRTTIESALKRSSPGFLKTVGLWTPPDIPQPDMFGGQQPSFKQYQQISQQLGQEYTARPVDLSSGQVPAGIDVLLVIASQNMSDKERYAIDQYLMQGGAVVVAAGNYYFNPDPMSGGLGVAPVQDGLRDMLAGYGINVQDNLVMDRQNEAFPIQVQRNLGGLAVTEIQALDYPYFVDVRAGGMDQESPILASLPAVTMNWVSPVEVDETKNAGREVDVLLQSSPQSWLSGPNPNVNPNPDLPDMGFTPTGEQKSYPLAVSVQGVFESYFRDKPSPLTASAEGEEAAAADGTESTGPENSGVGTIESSPENARLVVIGSAEFLNDIILNLSDNLSRGRFMNSLQFAQNTIDWSVEDLDLLTIRSRGTSARLLNPLEENDQRFWEIANYALALVALIGLGVLWHMRRQNEQPVELIPENELTQPAQPEPVSG